MKRAAFASLLLLVSFCAGGRNIGNTSVPGHGTISIEIVPNPIIATKVSGNTYDFPFDVVIRETGGHPVDVTNVSATVYALGGVRVASESYDASRIAQLGYPTRVPANGELRYRFNPRHDVTDDRLFRGVSADIRVEARDETGTAATAGTHVTVTKG